MRLLIHTVHFHSQEVASRFPFLQLHFTSWKPLSESMLCRKWFSCCLYRKSSIQYKLREIYYDMRERGDMCRKMEEKLQPWVNTTRNWLILNRCETIYKQWFIT
jgi:hypothetical protein